MREVEENKHSERVDTYRCNIYIEWTIEANGIKEKNEKKIHELETVWRQRSSHTCKTLKAKALLRTLFINLTLNFILYHTITHC